MATVRQPLDFVDVGDVLTAEEAARIAHIGYEQMLGALDRGELDAVRPAGQAWRIPKASLQRWLAGLPRTPQPGERQRPQIVELPR